MNIVIIGGGKLGYSLAITMLDRDFRVTVIEKNKVRAMNLANELDAEVICGDGTELEVLMLSLIHILFLLLCFSLWEDILLMVLIGSPMELY